jgi:CheY-like chemotaxis protein
MPVLDGFEATRQIRAFEEESWNTYSSLLSASPSSHPPSGSRDPVRRAVIIAMVPVPHVHHIEGLWERIVGAGFDLSVSKPLQFSNLADWLFSGPCFNVIGLYGGVSKARLTETGYPLQRRDLKPSRIEKEKPGEEFSWVIV